MQERVCPLALALACSLLGHGVLLFAMPLLPPSVQTPRLAGSIEVSLRAVEAPVPASAPSSLPAKNLDTPGKLPGIPTPKPPKPTRTPLASTPTIQATPTPAPLAIPAAVNTESSEPEGNNAAPVAALQTSATGAGDASRQGTADLEGMDDALLDYKVAIMGAARKFKRYPALARARGHEGRVDVRLIWRPGMRVPQVALHSGAGDTLLNEQGISMLRQAAEQTPLPPALNTRAFSLDLSVEFNLQDAN
ncbi:hypothetical protein AGMMS49545_13730 [Betaproteobacteria bacterium]|nr:hypothetical protein AGMMS49545_13730 [Betaproteobacteria bacterium]GHU45443.1 hypothetical protein AGMMS50289_16680 [Betaproteobacteria bacterium]